MWRSIIVFALHTGQLKELKSAADQGASIPLPEGNEDDDLQDDLDMEVKSFILMSNGHDLF